MVTAKNISWLSQTFCMFGSNYSINLISTFTGCTNTQGVLILFLKFLVNKNERLYLWT